MSKEKYPWIKSIFGKKEKEPMTEEVYAGPEFFNKNDPISAVYAGPEMFDEMSEDEKIKTIKEQFPPQMTMVTYAGPPVDPNSPVVRGVPGPQIPATPEYVFCPYCGTPVRRKYKFCIECGKKLNNGGEKNDLV